MRRGFVGLLGLAGGLVVAHGQGESRVFINAWNANNAYTAYGPGAAAGSLLGAASQTSNGNATWHASWDVNPAAGRVTLRENAYTASPGTFTVVQGGAILLDHFTVLTGTSGLAFGSAINVNVDVTFTGSTYTVNIPSGGSGSASLTLSAGQVIGTTWQRSAPIQLQHDSYDASQVPFNLVTSFSIATTVGSSFDLAMGIGSDLLSAAGTQILGATQPNRDVGFTATGRWALNPDVSGIVLDSASGFSAVPEPSAFTLLAGLATLGLIGTSRRRRRD